MLDKRKWWVTVFMKQKVIMPFQDGIDLGKKLKFKDVRHK